MVAPIPKFAEKSNLCESRWVSMGIYGNKGKTEIFNCDKEFFPN